MIKLKINDKIEKDYLLDFGAFLFRSGEESFRAKKDVELDKNIRDYIIETFKHYKNKKEEDKR